ncbi:MAG: AtpZ/AtpI family protein [Acidimicrobiales bacterium]
MDATQRRDLHDGIARSHGGFDLALSPVMFGLLGLWIDTKLGLVPLFTISFVVITFVGVVLKTFYVYRFRMNEEAKIREERKNSDYR